MIYVHVEEFEHVIVIDIQGMLTRETLKEAEDVWREQLFKQPEALALNFCEVSQIDSVSINHLFKFSQLASEKDVKLIIYDINESLKKILEVIKMDKVISIMPKNRFEAEYLKH